MGRTLNVLMLGPSAVSYTEGPPDHTTPALLEAALSDLAPDCDEAGIVARSIADALR